VVDLARDDPASTGSTTRADEPPAGSSTISGAASTLRLVATVGSPIAIATGLLFYFGWVRASVQARALGYDTTILDWTIQDYILRSINVLYLYDGLRLVQRSGNRYLLMSERWDQRTSRIIVLRDTDAIRLEFAR
jgi:hypothetical protein